MPNPVLTVVDNGPIEFQDSGGSRFMKGGAQSGVYSVDARGQNPLWLGGQPTYFAPVPSWNNQFWFSSDDADLLGNSSTTRPIPVVATDNVTAASKTWVIANGNFTQADVGRQLQFSGATNGGNNGNFIIQTVTNATTVVVATAATLVNETFSSPGAVLCYVYGPGAGIGNPGALCNYILNKGTNQPASFTTPQQHLFRQQGNAVFNPLFGSGRANNLPSIHLDGSCYFNTAAFTALTSPYMIAAVASLNPLAPSGNTYTIVDGRNGGGRNGFYVNTATGLINLLPAGTATTNAVGSNQVNSYVAVFNGASSFITTSSPSGIVTSALVNPGGTPVDGLTLGAFVAGAGSFMTGDFMELMVSTDPIAVNNPALVHSYFAAHWGALPA